MGKRSRSTICTLVLRIIEAPSTVLAETTSSLPNLENEQDSTSQPKESPHLPWLSSPREHNTLEIWQDSLHSHLVSQLSPSADILGQVKDKVKDRSLLAMDH